MLFRHVFRRFKVFSYHRHSYTNAGAGSTNMFASFRDASLAPKISLLHITFFFVRYELRTYD